MAEADLEHQREPRGKAKWQQVAGKAKDQLVSERAQVEGGIGSLKSHKYGFNKPAAKSANAMGVCGQRSVLGFNRIRPVKSAWL